MINFKYAVFISTFFIFLIEAILHYNVGKNGLTKYSQKLKTIQLIELKRRLEILS